MRKVMIVLFLIFFISREVHTNTITFSKESSVVPEYDVCGYKIDENSIVTMIKGRIAFKIYTLKGESLKRNIFNHEGNIEELTTLYFTSTCLNNAYSSTLNTPRYIREQSPLISVLLTHLSVKSVEDEQLRILK